MEQILVVNTSISPKLSVYVEITMFYHKKKDTRYIFSVEEILRVTKDKARTGKLKSLNKKMQI
jgi:hypothetical protein